MRLVIRPDFDTVSRWTANHIAVASATSSTAA
jgi:hypothetical protein